MQEIIHDCLEDALHQIISIACDEFVSAERIFVANPINEMIHHNNSGECHKTLQNFDTDVDIAANIKVVTVSAGLKDADATKNPGEG